MKFKIIIAVLLGLSTVYSSSANANILSGLTPQVIANEQIALEAESFLGPHIYIQSFGGVELANIHSVDEHGSDGGKAYYSLKAKVYVASSSEFKDLEYIVIHYLKEDRYEFTLIEVLP